MNWYARLLLDLLELEVAALERAVAEQDAAAVFDYAWRLEFYSNGDWTATRVDQVELPL